MHWLGWLNERDHFFQYFDHVFNSYHLGKGKRDPTLFDDIAARLALAPDEILFVDDLRSNVERAQAAGWHAIHYTDRASFEELIGKGVEVR
jgi:putative hydrolase of the HAD superfamily